MTNWTARTFFLAVLSAGALYAQEITGTWQGTLVLPNKQELRTVVKVSRDGAALKAVLYSIDQTPQGLSGVITLSGSTVKLEIPAAAMSYEASSIPTA